MHRRLGASALAVMVALGFVALPVLLAVAAVGMIPAPAATGAVDGGPPGAPVGSGALGGSRPAGSAAVGGSPPTGSAAVADIPPDALADYMRAAAWCPGLDWAVLAAIGKVESDHGRSSLPGVLSGANAAGAEGPMQFEPATFAAYAVATDGPVPSPYALGDAAIAAARLLCANGAGRPSGLPGAVWAYNHSADYVAAVLGWAVRYAGRRP